jgi:mycofactocin system glycosyltransferase
MRPLPPGFGLVLDPIVRRLAGGRVLLGGSPVRVIRLTEEGGRQLEALVSGRAEGEPAGLLARRLTDAGMAHPRPPRSRSRRSLTIVVPVRDRPELLDRCLAGLGRSNPVVVVDDGSRDEAATAAVCRAHGSTMIRLAQGLGPAAARNAGLAAVDTEIVAFVDSDCVPAGDWLEPLLRHFEDPLVGAVAPRIVPAGGAAAVISRYLVARSPLDMGGHEGPVGFGRRVPFVPTAAIVFRRSALDSGFDPRLSCGEDVDLVWRTVDRGWRVRYVPEVTVSHLEPTRFDLMLRRRFRYGTSAAALATRHPRRLRHAVISPWSASVAAALFARRPRMAVLALGAHIAVVSIRARRLGLPAGTALDWGTETAARSLIGIGHVSTMLAAPALLGALRPRQLRPGAALLLAIDPLVEWQGRRPPLDPLRWVATYVADECAYGAGVLVGCVVHRTIDPIRPTLAWRARQ